ncbi:DUF5361 domain-containing protein [Bifidobacterium biavatii]|uniref:Tail assembly chaperone n=1 Tax=Bifidobacterium biavatii DSM 23969 TaxID=1437608 RepID=A0A086ZU11_9BIFI|nr:DUF5361 domain-containing protein [Bifidobacterium biavatii]KFI50011.1 hypothetical protein BBIA_2144 [Bifidobacterium biavatii DSM 23969]
MLAKDQGALTADFQRYYGLDLDRLGHELTIHRAAALAANLPQEARVWAKLDPRLAWTDAQYLLADIRDSLDFLAWAKTKAASKTGARWKDRTPRPGDHMPSATPKAPSMDVDELEAFLALPRQ